PTQRDDCLRGATRYLLHAAIGETDFLVARQLVSEEIARWTAPQPRYDVLGFHAAERLAFLAIYQNDSPLHQLFSVPQQDIDDLSCDSFIFWLDRTRQDHLMNFDASAFMLENLELPTRDQTNYPLPLSLTSPRVPPGILFFDGDKFGVPALIMVSVGMDNAAPDRRIDQHTLNRLSCNRDQAPQFDDDIDKNVIASVRCFSYSFFSTAWWIGLAVRKTDQSQFTDFCRQAKELANYPDVVALLRDAPERSRGLYIMLPSRCKTND